MRRLDVEKIETLKEINCLTLQSFIRYLDIHNNLWTDNNKSGLFKWGFRGHGDKEWLMAPSAFRPDSFIVKVGKFVLNADLTFKMRHEIQQIHEFLMRADLLGLSVPGDSYLYRTPEGHQKLLEPTDGRHCFPPNEVLDTWALAQHHGIKTRLLDFSFSLKISAYFAACGSLARRPKDYSLLAPVNKTQQGILKRKYERSLSLWEESKFSIYAINLDFLHYLKTIDVHHNIVQISVPYADNRFIKSQLGLFLLDRDLTSEWDNYLCSIKEASANSLAKILHHDYNLGLAGNYPCLEKKIISLINAYKKRLNSNPSETACYRNPFVKINLASKHAVMLLEHLEQEGIDEASLKPTYDNVANLVNASGRHR